MSWSIVLDDKLSLLRRHAVFTKHSHHELCKTMAISVAERLCGVTEHDCLTVIHPNDSTETPVLHPFMRRAEAMKDAITHLPEPSPKAQLNRNFGSLMQWAITELFKYWGPSYPIQILVFTDGGASSFTNRDGTSESNWSKQWPSVSFLFVTLCDDQLSEDLLQVHRQFTPNSVIVPLNTHQTVHSNLVDVVTMGTRTVLQFCLPTPIPPALDSLTAASAATQVNIRFGHLGTVARLIPALRRNASIGSSTHSDNLPELSLEIFGFLHISDLSNPPVASRHQIRVASDTENGTFLSLLLTAMQTTKTVAMCTLHTHEASHSKTGSQIWRHGFLHQYDIKLSVLLLSVFHQDCTGLPWLGQFQHLAPVTDFAGTQLYDDRDGSSPFPVRVPDRLSYVPDTGVPVRPPTSTGTAAAPEPFRYVSWVSPATLTADVNKLLRLGRRLPDKATLFFKEFARLRTAALAYGCPDLLQEVVDLTKAAHPSYADGTAADALTTQLDNMCRMLDEPDFRPTST